MAVGIGHPYPQTISFLHQALPLLAEQGVRLVFVSEALQQDAAIALAGINAQVHEEREPGC